MLSQEEKIEIYLSNIENLTFEQFTAQFGESHSIEYETESLFDHFAFCVPHPEKPNHNNLKVFKEVESFEVEFPVPIINLILEYKVEIEKAEHILRETSRRLFRNLYNCPRFAFADGLAFMETRYNYVKDRIMTETEKIDYHCKPTLYPLYYRIIECFTKFDEDKFDYVLGQFATIWREMKVQLEDVPQFPTFEQIVDQSIERSVESVISV